jgi:3-isopropylmalate dehydrogenase
LKRRVKKLVWTGDIMGVYKIAVLEGDGIGPDVVEQAILILRGITEKYGHTFELQKAEIGGIAIDRTGVPLPKETVEICKQSDSVLLGAVGGPKWDNLEGDKRPEAGLLGIRSSLGLFANLRPAIIYSSLMEASPLKLEIIKNGIDIMVVRELTGGMYFGNKGRTHSDKLGETAFDTESYSKFEVERIARVGFESATKRRKLLTSVDKANVLESSRLWRETVLEVAKDYPDVELNHMYVDNAAMQLVRNPSQFDVIVTSNIFGDILSDEASMITGSIGMLPSASLSNGTFGLYEPIHGSAPDIAGKDIANPLATILSIAMMMNYSFNLPQIAKDIEDAVIKALNSGVATADIKRKDCRIIGTKEMGQTVYKALIDS